jgi:tRNA-binding EMAP/Myf-like protein
VDDLIVGRVLDVRDHPGARAPSYLLRLDLGPRGESDAQLEPGSYAKDELVGRLVVVSLADEAIVVCARSHAHGPVLVRPDADVEPGSIVA